MQVLSTDQYFSTFQKLMHTVDAIDLCLPKQQSQRLHIFHTSSQDVVCVSFSAL